MAAGGEAMTDRRERLAPILAHLDAAKESTFLDLCELLLMLSERIDGSIKWDHPRVLVHIKQRRRPKGPLEPDVRRKREKGK